MSKLYDYIPHPRAAELHRHKPVITADVRCVRHDNWLTRLDAKLGGDPIVIVAWIAQTFLQLVLLPIIIVGQNVQAQSTDARSEATYKDAQALLQETTALQQHLDEQDEQLLHLRE